MTIEELYGKLIADDEMKESFAEAIKAGTPMEWVKAQGVDATEEELLAYVKAAAFQSGELSDEALDKTQVAATLRAATQCLLRSYTSG